jgi:nitrate reductase alpha subunit
MPNHEPRGCARGASYSWYLYSANRVKYPLVRGRLLKLWRKARRTLPPVAAWASLVGDAQRRRAGRKCAGWAASRVPAGTRSTRSSPRPTSTPSSSTGPDRVIGFSPIPAMSMVSYAAGSRYLSLIGGVCMSFYDWYCDLPPASPQVWGEQTDVPESADWYNSSYIIAWGSNVPQTRTPDATLLHRGPLQGCEDGGGDPRLLGSRQARRHLAAPQAGHRRRALAMAFGHVALNEFYFKQRSPYFDDYARRYTDLPLLVMLKEHTLSDGSTTLVPDRYLRASDFNGKLGQDNNPEWKTVAFDTDGRSCCPRRDRFRWGPDGRPTGQWNLEAKEGPQAPT